MSERVVSDEQLAEWEALVEKLNVDEYNQAVPKNAPWRAQPGPFRNWTVYQPIAPSGDYRVIADELREPFATFIAAARSAIPALVRALRDARAENERIREAVLAEIGSWTHEVVEDCWYTCPAATGERDGGECCNDATRGGECDCGLEHRRERIRAALAAPTGQESEHGN